MRTYRTWHRKDAVNARAIPIDYPTASGLDPVQLVPPVRLKRKKKKKKLTKESTPVKSEYTDYNRFAFLKSAPCDRRWGGRAFRYDTRSRANRRSCRRRSSPATRPPRRRWIPRCRNAASAARSGNSPAEARFLLSPPPLRPSSRSSAPSPPSTPPALHFPAPPPADRASDLCRKSPPKKKQSKISLGISKSRQKT